MMRKEYEVIKMNKFEFNFTNYTAAKELGMFIYDAYFKNSDKEFVAVIVEDVVNGSIESITVHVFDSYMNAIDTINDEEFNTSTDTTVVVFTNTEYVPIKYSCFGTRCYRSLACCSKSNYVANDYLGNNCIGLLNFVGMMFDTVGTVEIHF